MTNAAADASAAGDAAAGDGQSTEARPEVRTVYVTKWAMTQGIVLKNMYVRGDSAFAARSCSGQPLVKGTDWFESEAAAVKRADVMKKAKIDALERSVKRLQAVKMSDRIVDLRDLKLV